MASKPRSGVFPNIGKPFQNVLERLLGRSGDRPAISGPAGGAKAALRAALPERLEPPLERADQAAGAPPSEPQTARVGWLRREFDDHPAAGLTPERLRTLMQSAEDGDLVGQLELADDMLERDAHLAAELGKRCGAITALPYSIEPPEGAAGDEKSLTDEVRDWVQMLTAHATGVDGGVELVISAMTDGILKGFAPLEQVWRYVPGGSGRKVQVPHLTLQPQRWFTLSSDRRSFLLRSREMTEGGGDGLPAVAGEPLMALAWLMHVHPARNGYLARMSLARTLFWPYLFKNYAVRDLAEFLEIYGLPLRVGKYPAGASDAEKLKLLQAVTSIGHNAAGIMPANMALDFQAAAAGTEVPFVAMWDRMDAAESKAILGQTLTASEGQHGTQALGEVHNEVRMDIRAADARLIERSFGQLIRQLVVVNKGGDVDPRRLPRLVLDTGEAEDMAAYAQHLPTLAKAGLRIGVRWVHDKLRIPEAGPDEPVLAVSEPDPADDGEAGPGDAGGGAKAPRVPPKGKPKKAALAARDAAAGDLAHDLIDDALADWRPLLAPMVEPLMAELQAAIAAGESAESFRDRLPALIERMDAGALGERLAQAAFSARLAGEADLDLDAGQA